MAQSYSGGPVGVETLAACYLNNVMFRRSDRTLFDAKRLLMHPRGRCLSVAGWGYLGLTPPAAAMRQLDLLSAIDDQPVLTILIKQR